MLESVFLLYPLNPPVESFNGKPVIIRVASTTANSSHFTTPDSGSFFIFGDPFRDMVNNLIKIDYKDKDSN